MARDTCRLPNCDEETRDDGQDRYANSFCSSEHEVKFDHLKDDARDAMAAEREMREEIHLPEADGPPY